MKALSVAALSCLALATGARAEQGSKFQVQWLILPDEAARGSRSVPPKGFVLKQRLLPKGAVRLTQDFVAPKVTDNLANGTELVLAVGAEQPVYCSQKFTPVFSLGVGIHKGSTRCFVDDDADGMFDRTFFVPSDIAELPSASGEIPRKGWIACRTPYTKIQPEDMSSSYYVGIQYVGQAKIGTLRRFMTAYGTEGRWGYFTGDNLFTKRDSDLPKSLDVFGSSVVVTGGDGKNVLVHVERSMPSQPFSVSYSVMYY